MRITIDSVDYAPDDLYHQVPIVARLTRQVPGDDRPDYWLGELARPLSWSTPNGNRTISHIVVAARWVGTSIEAGAQLPVGIAYVTDGKQLDEDRLDMKKASYVAIGMARVEANPG